MSDTMFMRSDLAVLRVRKDVNELSKAKYICNHAHTQVEFPDGVDNMLRLIFHIAIADHAGPYANGDFTFFVEIPKTYPFHPPIVTCLTRTWHPNIDVATGRVMITILGKDWRPVLSINTVLLGLQLIFLEPGINYVMNQEAADELSQDAEEYKQHVQDILCGGSFHGHQFPVHSRQVEQRRLQMRKRLKRSFGGRQVEDHDQQPSPVSTADDPVSHRPELYAVESQAIWKRKRLN